MNSNSTAGRGVAAGRRRGRQFRRGLGLGRETLARLGTERRGAVALIVALVLPVLLGVVALALEVGSWATARIDVQRQADITAMTAAVQYANGALSATTPDQQSILSNAAITAGTELAAVNGVTAANDASLTLTQVSGITSASDVAFKAVTSRQMSLSIGKVLSTLPFVTIQTSATAEIVTAPGGGGQPCLFTTSTTGTGIIMAGGSNLSVSDCTIRSNSGISVTNNATITAPWTFANQSTSNPVSITDSASITNGTHSVTRTNALTWDGSAPFNANSGTISDPYSSDSAVSGALSCAASIASCASSSGAISKTVDGSSWSSSPVSVSPGYYASGVSISNGNSASFSGGTYYINGDLNLASGTTTLGAGTYYVSGDVYFTGSSVDGTAGVTIIADGSVHFAGGDTVTLTAPTADASSGIDGIVLASNSSSGGTSGKGNSATQACSSAAICIDNGSHPTLGGAVYAPNGAVNFAGGVKSANKCLEFISNTASITNGVSLSTLDASACQSQYNVPGYTSTKGSTSVTLVQ